MLSFTRLLDRGLRPVCFFVLTGLVACDDPRPEPDGESPVSVDGSEASVAESEELLSPTAAANRELRLSVLRPEGAGPVSLVVGREEDGATVVLHEAQLLPGQVVWTCNVPGDLEALDLWAWGIGIGVAKETLELDDARAALEREVQLGEGRWARVRAVDEAGAPVAGAVLQPEPGRDSFRPMEPIAGPHPGEWFFEGRLSTRRLASLVDDQGRRAVFEVDLTDATHADLGDLVLTRDLALRGRLTAGGDPIPRAPILAQGVVRNRKVGRVHELFTDEDGRFELTDTSAAFQWRVKLDRAADPFGLGSWDALLATDEQELRLEGRWIELEAWLRGQEQAMTLVTLTPELDDAEQAPPSFGLRPHAPDPAGPEPGAAPRLAVHTEHAYRFSALVGDPDEFVAPWEGFLPGRDVPAVRRVSLEPNLSLELAELTVQVVADYPGDPLEVSLSVRRELQTFGNARVASGASETFGQLLPGDYSVSALALGAKDAVIVPPSIEFRLEPGEQREQVVHVYQGLLPELDLSGPFPAELPLGAELELELVRRDSEGNSIDYSEVVEFKPVGSAFSADGHNMFEALRLGALYRAKRSLPPGDWHVSLRHRVPDSDDVWSWESDLRWEPGGRPQVLPMLQREPQPQQQAQPESER